jgi:hypothetical protein
MSFAEKLLARVIPAALVLLFLVPAGRGGEGKPPPAAKNREQINQEAEARLKRDVTFLASPQCEGRGVTTEGINRAAEYIARQFQMAGLKPGVKNGWFQPFRIPGAEAKLALTGPNGRVIELAARTHFNALGHDQTARLTAPVVFAGYGITCDEPPYDDYAGLDVGGKVVVVLRDTPRSASVRTSKMMAGASLQAKLQNAMKHKAAAVLVVNDADTAQDTDAPLDYSFAPLMGGKRPPALAVRRSVVEAMLPAGQTLRDFERAIDRDMKPAGIELTGWKVSLEVARKADLIGIKNVVGVLEGNGPLAKETVVVGAHYDHLGYGGPSSLDWSKRRMIHHGADDNASGTTALIELARRFAAVKNRQGRRLVFIAFSGEELGLFGSRHYCTKPIYPLGETTAMLNLDMVGRLQLDPKTNRAKLLTEGHGTAKAFGPLIDALAKKHDFTLTSKESGFGPSDHSSFCGKKVPVLFFWTGVHADYHKPSDTADKINVPGMRRVVDLSEEALGALTTMEKPAFVEVKGTPGVRPTSGPRLGIRPGYGGDTPGVEVEGVSPGGPAEKGGIKDGDRIVAIAGKPIKNLNEYMQVMAAQQKGSTIEITVVRKGDKVKLKIALE